MKRGIKIGLLVVGIFGIAFFLIIKFGDAELKREIFGTSSDSPFGEVAQERYLLLSEQPAFRQKILTKEWIIWGAIKNTHPNKTFSRIELRINFADGSEDYTLHKTILPNGATIFRIKIGGHPNASPTGFKIISGA